MTRVAAIGALIVSLGVAAPSLAAPTDADKKQARALMEEGDAFTTKKDYSRALEKYRAADAIMHVPSTGLQVAQTLVALGRLIDARDAALAVTRLPPIDKEPEAFTKARQEAEKLAAALGKRIPSLEVIVIGVKGNAEVVLEIDGKTVPAAAAKLPRKLDPGSHEVTASAVGSGSATKRVTLAEGANEKLEIDLAAPSALSTKPSAKPSAKQSELEPTPTNEGKKTSSLVYIGFGVGAAGLVVGSVTGYLSLSKASKAKDQCDGNRCPSSAKDDIDASKSLATISNIGFGVAIVGAGVGVYGLLSSKKSSEKPPSARALRVEPLVGTRFVGVGGRF